MMARKADTVRTINVAVVGLSGMEKDKGHAGVGKSCLCNRFMRSHADDYNVDHISVLSQTDFSGRVVNNDHFLYWGEVIKTSEEGIDYQFSVIEQTEFIDDASFQPFKGGKMEPYIKRCAATKITSAEKLMYICKNQLGIEKEYEQKVLPDGKLNIDGFICVFDVSIVPSRSLEKQVEIVAAILNNLVKTKKPIVFVTTKNDDANELFVREADKLLQRKEYKGAIPLVETSAHDNVNVDLAFMLLAQIIDRSKVRSKVISYAEAARARKELMDVASEAFMRLIRLHVTDCRALWSHTVKKLNSHKEWIYFVQLFGLDGTQRLFRRHIKKLKDEQLAKRIAHYMEMLPDVLHELVPDINTLTDSDWPSIQQYLKTHPDFSQYFYECPEDMPWTECELESDNEETRIPFDVLEISDAETVFKNHINVLQQEQKRLEMPKRWKKQFKQLLEDTGYVTPGKHLSEVRVLFMGRECFEALSEHDCQQIYDAHQRELIENAKHNFQELLLEHADLFYHFKSIAPTGTITQDDIKEITDVLQDDFRYKMLDRLDQDRKVMLFQHLGFIHCPIREHCPAFPNCMDALIERILATKVHRPSSWNHSNQWLISSDNNQLHLLILGADNLAENLAAKIRAQCEDDEYEIDCQFYSLDYRIINGDVSLPHNSFRTADFVPHGSFCVYSNAESFEYIRESLEKTLLSNLEQEDKLPFQGLPIVLMFLQDSYIEEKDVIKLREEGQSLADSLQCPFMDVCLDQITEEQLVSDALHQLVQSIHHRAGFLNIYQSVIECVEPDIRIIMCTFCGDSYSIENVLAPLLSHQCCFLSAERSIILETFLGDSKRKVEVIVSSFHGANAFRDELVHGFILVYSTKRKASLATLNAFSMNIPNLPIQILAVTDSGGANAFFNNDLSHLLITEGNATADRLHAHFMTSSSSSQQKTAFFTPFFKEVWEKKPEIEQAFHMEEPSGLDDSGEGTLEHPRSQRHGHPLPPPRHESYQLKLNDGSGSENYELNGPDERLSSSDHSDKYSHIYMYGNENGDITSKKRLLHQGFQVYPPPTTPPEPAPPDHSLISRIPKRGPMLSASQTSLDEITSDISGSRESLATHDSDGEGDQPVSISGSAWNNYGQHAFTTGRRHVTVSESRPKGISQTLKQPGKLNLKNYSVVTEAIARMNVSGKDIRNTNFGNAPLATPEVVDLGCEYAQVKDMVHNMYPPDAEYMYTLVQDAVSGKSKLRQRREKAYSDTDSEWSSLERRQRASEVYSKVNRKSGTHKRQRKKRTAIPVQPPRVPQLGGFTLPSVHSTPHVELDADKTNVGSESNSDSSEGSDAEQARTGTTDSRNRFSQKRSFSLKKRVPVSELHNTHNLNIQLHSPDLFSIKPNSYGIHDDESSLDVSSPRDNNSPMFGVLPKMKESDREKLLRKREKQKAKDDSKLEKQRRLKEEKLRKVADKEKERDKKKQQKIKQKAVSLTTAPSKLSDFIQNENNYIPIFLEKCVKFIESEGLESEGIYRVPGNRAHVDLLFQKFDEDSNVDIHELDIPVNAVATALKDFVSKRLPPLFEEEVMSELEEIAVPGTRIKPMATTTGNVEVKTDRSCRLLALRSMLEKLPKVNFQVLKFVFQHFVKVAENSKLNNMDSKNLAICWWPTLLPIEFSDMGRFEQMRPYLEDIVQTMINQYPFLFCGKEAFVMV
ncbi:rho GTPase-activating protein 190 isoform X2 [Tenebrio molitor]|uniref:rho GTPase-activating protein 190 isoform X2 n=1 Tax=Tenebrio molitor TaxID=7067 RepID=UPI003624724F